MNNVRARNYQLRILDRGFWSFGRFRSSRFKSLECRKRLLPETCRFVLHRINPVATAPGSDVALPFLEEFGDGVSVVISFAGVEVFRFFAWRFTPKSRCSG